MKFLDLIKIEHFSYPCKKFMNKSCFLKIGPELQNDEKKLKQDKLLNGKPF